MAVLWRLLSLATVARLAGVEGVSATPGALGGPGGELSEGPTQTPRRSGVRPKRQVMMRSDGSMAMLKEDSGAQARGSSWNKKVASELSASGGAQQLAETDCSSMGGTDCSGALRGWAGAGTCVAVVSTKGQSCTQYCRARQMTCAKGADDYHGQCRTSGAPSCDRSLYNQICACAPEGVNAGGGTGASGEVHQQAAAGCSTMDGTDCSGALGAWAGAGTCVAIVDTQRGTCTDYCQARQMTCVKGADDYYGQCQISGTPSCDRSLYNQICVCAPEGVTAGGGTGDAPVGTGNHVVKEARFELSIDDDELEILTVDGNAIQARPSIMVQNAEAGQAEGVVLVDVAVHGPASCQNGITLEKHQTTIRGTGSCSAGGLSIAAVVRLGPHMVFTQEEGATTASVLLWPDAPGGHMDRFCQTASHKGAKSVPTADNDALTPAYILYGTTLQGRLEGLGQGREADVLMGTFPQDTKLESKRVTAADSSFSFSGLEPDHYWLKVDAAGFELPRTRAVVVCPPHTGSTRGHANLRLGPESYKGAYRYVWKEDESRSGHEERTYLAHVNKAHTVEEVPGENGPVGNNQAGQELLETYKITCADSQGVTWNAELKYRLLETLKTIPQRSQRLTASTWQLTNDEIANDITFDDRSGRASTVTVAKVAFANAHPKIVLLDGVRSKFFSKRLHHAALRFVTNNGKDKEACEHIFKERFGCSLRVPDYTALTRSTTRETESSFEDFLPEEKVHLLNMFEEMPVGFHKIAGLDYLVRRKQGTTHPLYPQAAAVAWPMLEKGYIEWMDGSFGGGFGSERLALHEKTHFIYDRVLDEKTRQDWIQVGGWYQRGDVWLTTKQTEFVSAYAHLKNPNEDLAETVAFYTLNPDKLRSRAPEKYDFVRDRIMKGYRYVAKIREDLTFQVMSLEPDYIYPGKINRVEIHVKGEKRQDKHIWVQLDLHQYKGTFSSASSAGARITSESGTFKDMTWFPIDPSCTCAPDVQPDPSSSGCRRARSHKLCGKLTLNKLVKRGWWRPAQIKVRDEQGNERFEGQADFGWQMWIDTMDDQEAPTYVGHSLTAGLQPPRTVEGHEVRALRVEWDMMESMGIRVGEDNQLASVACDGCAVPARQKRGRATHGAHHNMYRATVDFEVTEYWASGTYEVREIIMGDMAGNDRRVRFSADQEPVKTVQIQSRNPDTRHADLDVRVGHITVKGEQAGSEQTRVTVTVKAKDDKSGVGMITYSLRDPQGISHFEYLYQSRDRFFKGDPTAWKTYSHTKLLPIGAAHGTWGVSEVGLVDKAGNRKTFKLNEVQHFQEFRAGGLAELGASTSVNVSLLEFQVGGEGGGGGGGVRLLSIWQMPVRHLPAARKGQPPRVEPIVPMPPGADLGPRCVWGAPPQRGPRRAAASAAAAGFEGAGEGEAAQLLAWAAGAAEEEAAAQQDAPEALSQEQLDIMAEAGCFA